MKNAYISTGVHVRRLSGQTKQENLANIQTAFLVRILEPVWASFFDVDILQRLSIKVKRTLRSVFSLKKVLKTSMLYYLYIYYNLLRPTKIENVGILFDSVFFVRLRIVMDAICFHSFDTILDWLVGTFHLDLMWWFFSVGDWYLFCASLVKTTGNLCFICRRVVIVFSSWILSFPFT